MANLLSYTLKIVDLFTAPLRKAAVDGESSMGRVTRAAQRVQAATGKAGTSGAASLGKLSQAAQGAAAKAVQMGSSFSAANQRILSTSTRATSSLNALEIKLNTLKQERRVALNLNDLARANRAIQEVEQKMDQLENHGRRSGGGFGLGGLIGGLAIAGGVAGLMGGVRDTAQMQGMNNAITFAAGSAKEGATTLQFLDRSSDKLGLNLLSATEGYRTLAGSMMGTKLQGEGTRRIFQQVATATTVMGASGEDQKGVFLALGQIMSKGKVQAEELRGQIGERIPGAFKIAADAMGVSQAALNKMMDDGKLTSDVFLPRFAAQLQKVFGPGLAKAVNSTQANLNRFDNDWLKTKTILVEALLPTVMELMAGVRSTMEVVRAATRFVQEHATAFKLLATFILPVVAAVMAYSAYVRTAAMVTGLWTTAQMLLNGAMMLNPVGLVIAGIAALTAGIIYAWNKFEGFRGFLYGFAASVKQIFKGIGDIVMGALTLDHKRFIQGHLELLNVAKAARGGYAQGVAAFRAGNAPGAGGTSPDQQMAASGPMPAGGGVGLPNAKGKSGGATGAGRGVTHITINIQSLGQTTIHSTSVREGVQEQKEAVRTALLSVLNDANAMTT
ncbi:tape measure protein [Hymenobacter metallicola]|uniref:Tape measure protein N-terminal domain-containing protein n=1 Tax=Hymenobacter metallicola TaxID=2563114 RepID=A0A4Z0Q1J1_9BACT|nr:tape measure protein [Hymenobacter metallicola]TGE23555.1 hypothetical protein E5K02_20430 [Hymenobacter metallicola]